jgi:non-heme chloroperoxidase
MQTRPHLKKIEINNTILHYIEAGEEHSQSVVFVHGGLGDYRTWNPQIRAFSEQYHVISYSRRAFYPNPWPPDYRAAMMQHVDDLAELITRLNVAQTHLVANSYGGYVCLNVALLHPELVCAMALAEPPVQPLLAQLPGGAEILEEVRMRAWVASGDAFAKGELEDGVRLFLDGAVGQGTFHEMQPRVREAMMRNAPEMSAATLAEYDVFMPDFSCEDARKIVQPTLLLRGANSPKMYYLINDELARCIPYSEQALIPDAAHVLNNHNPEAHNHVVLDFLSRHTKR